MQPCGGSVSTRAAELACVSHCGSTGDRGADRDTRGSLGIAKTGLSHQDNLLPSPISLPLVSSLMSRACVSPTLELNLPGLPGNDFPCVKYLLSARQGRVHPLLLKPALKPAQGKMQAPPARFDVMPWSSLESYFPTLGELPNRLQSNIRRPPQLPTFTTTDCFHSPNHLKTGMICKLTTRDPVPEGGRLKPAIGHPIMHAQRFPRPMPHGWEGSQDARRHGTASIWLAGRRFEGASSHPSGAGELHFLVWSRRCVFVTASSV